jgi:hypothetical protein
MNFKGTLRIYFIFNAAIQLVALWRALVESPLLARRKKELRKVIYTPGIDGQVRYCMPPSSPAHSLFVRRIKFALPSLRTILRSAVLLTSLCFYVESNAHTLTFQAAVPGTLQDKAGLGSGLTAGLPGTGAALDPNLQLRTTNGVILLTGTDAEINGQVNMESCEFLRDRLPYFGIAAQGEASSIATHLNLAI